MLVGEPPVLKSYIACAGIYHREEFPVSFSVSVSVSFAFLLFFFSLSLSLSLFHFLSTLER